MQFKIFAVALITILSSCGSSNSGGSGINNPGGDNETRTFEFNGKPTDQYFRQFIYKKDSDKFSPYRFLTADDQKLRVEGEKTRYANSRLFLLENGTYVLKYEEALGKPNSTGGMAGIIDFEQELRGTWKVDEMNLVISDVGTGAGLIYNDKETVALKFEHNIHSEGLNGKIAIMSYVHSNVGL